MKKSSIGLLTGLVLVWGATEFKFLVAPRLTDQGIRATIERCVEKYGSRVLWEVKEPILLKPTLAFLADWSKVKQISTSAMRDYIKSAHELGVDLVHLKQNQAGSECQFFFEDKDAVQLISSDEPLDRLPIEEGTEIDDGETRLHFHQGRFFRVYASGSMSSFSIFGLRNVFPFWEVWLVYPQYLVSRLMPYVLVLGLALVVASVSFKAAYYFKSKLRSQSRKLESKARAWSQQPTFPVSMFSEQHKGDPVSKDSLVSGKDLVFLASLPVQENKASGGGAPPIQKSPGLAQFKSLSQAEFEKIVENLESLRRETRSKVARTELDFMLAELYSGRHGIPGARLFLKRAQALAQTSVRIRPNTVGPNLKRPTAQAHGCLGSLSGEDIVWVLAKVGYQYERDSRNHFFLKCPGRPSVSIPKHDDIHPDRLRGILRKTGISLAKFNALYNIK